MSIKFLYYGLLAATALLPASAAAQALQLDTDFRTGKLANGLTYYIRHNAKEAGIADFYIAQRVGSILEEPRQRGLAHFLEHMAFNGTEHFRGDSRSPGIVPWCETIGVKFGTNLNAYTSVDQTVYNISSVPLKRDGIIDSTLLILHDWSHSLLLTDKEIDKERGVIHEEWRTRRAGMATQRMIEKVLPVIYKGTKYEDCLPIGSMEIIDNFPYQDLRDYYKKWYRPDLQAIIVVGDVDVDKMEARLKRIFGTIPAPVNPSKRVYYPVADNQEMVVAVDKDSEQPIMLATLYMKHDAPPDSLKNRVEARQADYVESLIASMLNGRLQELQHQSVPPCLSATAGIGDFFVSRTKKAFSLSFGCRQENIKGSFDAVMAESERARRFGFTAAELERAKAIQLKAAERRFAERNDRRNNYFVRRALRNFLQAEPMLSDQAELDLVRSFNHSVSLDRVNAATARLISNRNQVLVVYAPDKPGFVLPSNAQMQQYVTDAQARSYEPYKEAAVAKELMTTLPKKGKIVSERDFGRHGVRVFKLSNGVNVYVKSTDFAKDQVSMSFSGKGGKSLFPDADIVNMHLLPNAISSAGVSTFDAPTLRKMLASNIVRLSPFVADDSQGINGSSSVKDLKTMFQLTYLYFTQLRKDTTAFNGEVNRTRSFLTNREANPQVSYNDSLAAIVYGNSPRVQPLKRDMLDRVNYDRVLQMYRQCFASATGFNMILVGNIDLDVLRPLLCRYVASLPAGKGLKPRTEGAYPHPDVKAGNETHLFAKEMKTPSALVNIIYTFDEPFTPKADLAADIFKRVLTIAYTDSVREENGGTYGVSVSYAIDPDSKPKAFLKVNFRTDPAKYAALIPIVYRQIEQIAQKGPEPSSMAKVKAYLLKAYKQAVITNDYWAYIIENEVEHQVDFHTGYEQLVEQITPADVQQIARDLLKSNRRLEITMISK